MSLFGLVVVLGFLSGLAQIVLGDVLVPEETAEANLIPPTETPDIDGTIAAAIDGTLTPSMSKVMTTV